MTETDAEKARAMLERNLELIRRIIVTIAARKRLAASEREEFQSFVMLKLLENDCARLRYFRGQSSPKTYLTVVIQRLFVDYKRQELGTWRASARARAMGPLAVRVERQLHRDGLTFQEIYQGLCSEGISISRDELWQLAEELPRRFRPRIVDIDSLADPAISRDDAETSAISGDQHRLRLVLEDGIREAMGNLPPGDALVLKMWFERGMTAPAIARALGIRPREVYSTIRRCTNQMRKSLESHPLEKDDVMELVTNQRIEMDWFAGIG